MKVYQDSLNQDLSTDLQSILNDMRLKRAFNVETYLHFKTILLNNYLDKFNVKSVVVGISGGIDSAVVLAMLIHANKSRKNKLNIIPVTLPCFMKGVSNQSSTVNKANELCYLLNVELHTYNVSGTVDSVYDQTNLDNSEWAIGQLIPPVRTNYLYHIATSESDEDRLALIIGTNNFSELSLGFVGKYSDGMVDIQLISDIFKSEVYQIASYFKLPASIINAKPNGDMFDNRPDTEVFGASYDFVELYINYLNSDSITRKEIESINGFDVFASNLAKLRKYNFHKFITNSPAIHLDLFETGCDGYKLNYSSSYYKLLDMFGDIHKTTFIKPFKADFSHFNRKPEAISLECDNNVFTGKLLNDEEVNILKYASIDNDTIESGVDGYIDGTGGSYRNSTYSLILSKYIFNALKEICLVYADKANTDYEEGSVWKCIGVNPYMRFINYEAGQKLIPHYDYSYKMNDKIRSLYSVIIYLTDNEEGATRFYKTKQDTSFNKDLSDGLVDGDVLDFVIKPKKGHVAIFPHHIKHDGDILVTESKLILRTDLMFERISV